MGVVVEAKHLQLHERVALKFLLPEYAGSGEAAERFLREARAAAKIKSSHVARVVDVGTLDGDLPYMVMEFLDGTDAAVRLERGVLSVEDAVDYVVQACDAIADAHAQGIVHRDLKPANLFVSQHSDGSPMVKVLDFGISKVVGDDKVDSLTRTTATVGSALYMSPEQIKQSRSVDHRTDIYALGVTLYELLAGRQPFIADNFPALCVEIATGAPTPLRELRPDVSPELAQVLERAYERDRERRFQSVAELVVALAPWAPARSHTIIQRLARAGGMQPAAATGMLPHPAGVTAAYDPSTNASFAQSATNAPMTAPRKTTSVWLPVAIGGGLLVVLSAAAIGVMGVVRGSTAAQAPASAEPLESALPAQVEPLESAAPVEFAPSADPAPSAEAPPKAAAPPKPQAVTPKAAPKAEPPAPKPAATPAPAPTPKKYDAYDVR